MTGVIFISKYLVLFSSYHAVCFQLSLSFANAFLNTKSNISNSIKQICAKQYGLECCFSALQVLY